MLLPAPLQHDALSDGKYVWILILNGQTQQLPCQIECNQNTFQLKSGRRDPIPGTISDQDVTFELKNDANSIKGSGVIGEDGWVRGKVSIGQGEVTIAEGSFLIAPRETKEQRATIDAYLKASLPKLKLPRKTKPPAFVEHPNQILHDHLGELVVSVPRLPGSIKLADTEISPATKLFRFEFENGDQAVLISTKMRNDRPKDDSAVVRVEPRYQRLQQFIGSDKVEVQLTGKSPNRMLSYTVINPASDDSFPLSIRAESIDTLQSIAVSQIVVKSGRFMEFAVLSKNYDAEERAVMVAKLTEICNSWRASLDFAE